MMIKSIVEKINEAKAQMTALETENVALVANDKFGEDEKTKFDVNTESIKDIKANIKRFESVKEASQSNSAEDKFTTNITTYEAKAENKVYNIGKAYGEFLNGGIAGLSGINAEVHSEYSAGQNFMIPDIAMAGLTSTTEAGHMGKEITPEITIMKSEGEEYLRGLGVSFMNVKKGADTLYLPKAVQTSAFSSPEAVDTSSNLGTPNTTSIKPVKADGYAVWTNQYLDGAEPAVLAGLIQDMVDSIGRETVDRVNDAILTGADSSTATVGGTLDYEGLIALTKLKYSNMSSRAFVASTNVRAFLETKNAGGDGIKYIWTDGNTIGGRKAVESNSLSEGYVIYGDWSKVVVAQRPGITLLRNPYSLDTSDQVRLTARAYNAAGLKSGLPFNWTKDSSLA